MDPSTLYRREKRGWPYRRAAWLISEAVVEANGCREWRGTGMSTLHPVAARFLDFRTHRPRCCEKSDSPKSSRSRGEARQGAALGTGVLGLRHVVAVGFAPNDTLCCPKTLKWEG
jgi:hypothetical protein